MLVETLIQNILEMQGVHVDEVAFVNGSREVELVPARGYAPCCGVCGSRAAYRDTRRQYIGSDMSVVGNCCLLFALCSLPREL